MKKTIIVVLCLFLLAPLISLASYFDEIVVPEVSPPGSGHRVCWDSVSRSEYPCAPGTPYNTDRVDVESQRAPFNEETHYGTVQILRDGKITPLDSYIKANTGDIIKTGSDGFIEYRLNDTVAKFGPDTIGVTLGINNSDKKVTTPYEWDKDPNYRPELDNWEFWKNTANDLGDFIGQNRPNYLKHCAVGNVYECTWGTVEFIHGGVGWFSEKMEKDFKKSMIITPTIAMVPVGTEFSVAVAQDGATTVTTLDGEVIVMDLTSRKSAIVGTNQSITISKTTTGLTTAELQQSLTNVDPSSIDKWWEKPIQKNGLVMGNNLTKIIFLLTVFGIIITIIIKRKNGQINFP